MAKKTIEVNEDDFKKVMLMLKYSKPFVKLEPTDLFLGNLWRVAPKLADTLTKKAGYVFVENKGKKTLKLASEVVAEVPEVNTAGAETGRVDSTKPAKVNKPKDEKPVETPAPDPEPAPTTDAEKPAEDSPKSDTGSEEPKEEVRVPRCRKRKNKK